jgi:gas vesicle structural protein
MAVERAPAGTSLIDVLDRVLDKGIVIDAYVRVSLVGIDLVSVEARIVVASVETYLKYAEAIGITGFASRPGGAIGSGGGATELDRVRAENVELKRRLEELS